METFNFIKKYLSVCLILLLVYALIVPNAFALELHRKQNTATTIVIPLIDSTDNVAYQSGATSPDSEIVSWNDTTGPGSFSDCTNEVSEIGSTGVYALNLTAGEMNNIYHMIKITATDAITQTILINCRNINLLYNVETDTQDLQTQIGTDGAGLTNMPWNSSWDTEVESEATDALTAYDPPTDSEMDSAISGLDTKLDTIDDFLDTEIALILADTGELQTNQGNWLTATGFSTHDPQGVWEYNISALVTAGYAGTYLKAVYDDWVDGGRLDLLLDATKAKTDNLPSDPADDSDIDAAIAALNNISTAQVNTEVDNAIETYHLDHLLAAEYDPASKPGNAAALFNELIENDGGVSRLTANSLEQAPTGGANPNVLIDTTIGTVNTQTNFTLAAGSDVDDAYNDQAIVVYDASNNDYPSVRVVSDYTGSSKTITLDSAPDFTILSGDGVKVFTTAPGTVAPTAAQIRAEIDSNSTQLSDIKAKTDNLPADPADDSDIDGQLATIQADLNDPGQYKATGFSTHSAADVRTEMDNNSADLNTIITDTNEMQGDLTNGGRLDLLIDAIKAITDTFSFTGSDVKATLDGENVTVGDIIAAALAKFFSVDSLTTYGAAVGGSVVKEIADNAGGGSSITQQEVRDAMKLAPTAGAPAAGSVDAHLDDTLADTNEIQGDLVNGGRLDLLIDAIKAITDQLTFTGSDVNVTLDGEQVVVSTNNDKTGYTVSAATAAFLQDLFTTDSGETYSSAVAGSVIKEIADNASAVAAKDWSTEENTNIYAEINGLREYLLAQMKIHRG